MALVNHAKKEINAKIVYYGAAGCGKSTALNYIYSRIKPSLRGELKNVPAGADNLLLFDFSPFEAPLPGGYRLRLHVYTLTGSVSNPATWKMTLKGADGIIIMVNPAAGLEAENRESVAQLRDFLSAYGVNLHETPSVLQINSFTDSKAPVDARQLADNLELGELTPCQSNAARGEGLLEALAALSRQILDRVNPGEQSAEPPEVAQEPPPQAPASPEAEIALPDQIHAEEVSPSPDDGKPGVSILNDDIRTDGTQLTIPLEVHCGETKTRFVVTVSIAAE